VAAFLAALAPDSRSAASEQAEAVARAACGLGSLHGFTRSERLAWTRLAPLFAALPLREWSDADRASLVALARAKGGRSERSYVRLSAKHQKLERALASWSLPTGAAV